MQFVVGSEEVFIAESRMDIDLSVEISALEHVFGPFQTDVDDLARARQLDLTLSPYTGDDDTIFVDMDACFHMGMQYPDEAPTIDITSSRGLSDQRIRQIVRAMQAEAQELAGEHMLMSMCMAAKEALTQHNHPEGIHIVTLSLLVSNHAVSES